MKQRLAIKAHPTRGKEVIELLKMMGGVNADSHKGHFPDEWKSSYYIYGDNTIQYARVEFLLKLNFKIFTLEEFLEKFPFKVGDKVEYIKYNDEFPGIYIIDKMCWTGTTVEYTLGNNHFTCLAKDIRLYKETNMKENTTLNMSVIDYNNGLVGYEIPKGYEFDRVENGKIILKPIKTKYPINYQECCDVLGLPMQNALEYINTECNKHEYYNDLQSTLNSFVSLKICRDAYWKIAGKEMGLNKSWEPDLENEELYCIQNYNKQITISKTNTAFNKFLIFPTKEMRDAFYENFKNLIEECKELL